jgi:hypothetical protein
MRRDKLLAAAVVGLVLLAGCSGITGSSGNGGGDYPAASGIGADQIDVHASALANTSFTATVQTNVSGSQASFNSTTTAKIDPADDQYLQASHSGFGDQTRYTDGDTTYERSEFGNETQVSRSDRPVNVTSVRRGGQILSLFVSENVTYSEAGTETFDGDEVMAYEAEGVDALSDELLDSTSENASITDFSATVLVDGDGVIRSYQLEYVVEQDGETQELSYVAEITDVGSTDVEEPAWVSQAGTTSA